MASKITISHSKEPGFLGEMAGSMSGAGNAEDESGTSCHLEGKEAIRDLESCVKGLRS